MKVKITKHAFERCEQQGISIKRLKQEVMSLPSVKGRFKWKVKSGESVVYNDKVIDGEKIREVITVIGVEKQDFRLKHYMRKRERRGRRASISF